MNTLERAAGKWRFILSHFGVEEVFLRNVHGPCPVCGGNDRYRFDDKDGNGTYYCSQCGPGTGMMLLQKFKDWDFKQAADEIDKILPGAKSDPPPKQPGNPDYALNMIRESARPAGAEVDRYLKGRGISKYPSSILQVRRHYYVEGAQQGEFDCMCVPIWNSNKVVSYHLTYLKDGEKAKVPSPRKLMRSVSDIQGSAARLAPPRPHLGVAEGIETAIAVMLMYKIPCWSVLSESLMRTFVPPPEVTKLTIFGDNDKNFVGQRAAYELAWKTSLKGIDVSVMIPDRPGTDFLDELNAKAVAA